MTITAPETVGESLDPRDPLLRLRTFFDDAAASNCCTSVTAPACWPRRAPSTACAPSRSAPTAPSWAAPWAWRAARHIVNAYDTAIEEQSPIVGIWHSGGARLAEGVKALHAVGLVFEAMIRASGYVPQISVVVGFAAGGAAYGPALTDVIVMAPDSRVFVTGPDVVRSVTGEDVDMASLGGPDTHHKKSGVCHIVADDELDAYAARPPAGRIVLPAGPFRPHQGRSRRHRPARAAARVAAPRLRRAPARRGAARRGRAVRGVPGQVGAVDGDRPRPAVRPHRRRARQQPAAPRWLPELRKRREGSTFRAAVRRVRHSAGRRRRRARLPARCGPGVGRRGAPRRQAAARVRRVPRFRGSRW